MTNISDIQKELSKQGIDLIILSSLRSLGYDENIFYLTGYEGLGFLIIPKSSKPFIVAPALDYNRAKLSKLKCYRWEKGVKPFDLIQYLLKKNRINYKTLGIDMDKTSLRLYKSMLHLRKKKKIVDISDMLRKKRAVKTEKEIMILKKAAYLADTILKKALRNIRSFKTEAEVAAYLEYETKKTGCDISFPPIVASGSNGGMPHHTPQNIVLKKGFCVIDFGVKYKGYCSDITRTIYLGKPSLEEIKAYFSVLKVQSACISMCISGTKCSDIFNYAFSQLGEAFCHGLGHGVGVEIHELPNLKANSNDVLEKGMVLTVEPGIYYENKYGIRIEDDILVTDNKPVILTKLSRNLLIIR